MSIRPPSSTAPPALNAHLLGTVEYAAALALQQRSVFEAGDRGFVPEGGGGQRIMLLLSEHEPVITLGRGGSREDVRMSDDELKSRRVNIVWTNRGGGAWPHLPGQLAVYPIVPLAELGWTVGEYLRRLQVGLQAALTELNVPTDTRPGSFGLWGRSGQLIGVGAAVKNWITYHGAFLNVAPEMNIFRRVVTDRNEKTPAGSLAQERQGHVPMQTVRSAVVRHLSEAFSCDRYHLHTGHPLLRVGSSLPNRKRSSRESARRAS